MLEERRLPLQVTGEGLTWHTFAGGAINRLLAIALERATGKRWMSGNLSVRTREAGITSATSAIAALGEVSLESAARQLAADAEGPLLSKFEPCLPPRFAEELWTSRMIDTAGAREVLQSPTTVVAGTASA